MDERLEKRLKVWHDWTDVLTKSEHAYLKLEAYEKSLFSKLFLEAEGKTVAEKEALVYVKDDWGNFKGGLVAARSQYFDDRRKLEIHIKEYEATYLTYKVEAEAISRKVGR